MHIQVIVSRKDITNKIKLSPMNKSRGRNTQHSKKLGQFDRVAFKNSGERLFDQQFGFDRPISETFKYVNTQAKGNLQEKLDMKKASDREKPFQPESIREESQSTYLKLPEQTNYLGLLLEKEYSEPLGTGLKKKRKRRKHKSQENEQGLGI